MPDKSLWNFLFSSFILLSFSSFVKVFEQIFMSIEKFRAHFPQTGLPQVFQGPRFTSPLDSPLPLPAI
jgi:hypothetical protein